MRRGVWPRAEDADDLATARQDGSSEPQWTFRPATISISSGLRLNRCLCDLDDDGAVIDLRDVRGHAAEQRTPMPACNSSAEARQNQPISWGQPELQPTIAVWPGPRSKAIHFNCNYQAVHGSRAHFARDQIRKRTRIFAPVRRYVHLTRTSSSWLNQIERFLPLRRSGASSVAA